MFLFPTQYRIEVSKKESWISIYWGNWQADGSRARSHFAGGARNPTQARAQCGKGDSFRFVAGSFPRESIASKRVAEHRKRNERSGCPTRRLLAMRGQRASSSYSTHELNRDTVQPEGNSNAVNPEGPFAGEGSKHGIRALGLPPDVRMSGCPLLRGKRPRTQMSSMESGSVKNSPERGFLPAGV